MWKDKVLNHSWRQCVATMQAGVVVLVFIKKTTKDYRVARATLDLSRIPQAQHPKGCGRGRACPEVVTFYDLDVGGWRSFRKRSLIGFYRPL